MHQRYLLATIAGTLIGCAPAAMQPSAPVAPALARGPISQSAIPTNLAISGDAFFVLARTTPPRSLDDLVLAREGAFHVEYKPGDLPNTGTYRLVNPDDLAVMGWASPVDVNVRPFGTSPEEAHGTDLTAFRTVVTNGQDAQLPVPLAPVELDHERNPDAATRLSFDSRGMLRFDGNAPHDLEGRDANIQVVLAKADVPSALRHEGGGYLAWTPGAGTLHVGTAADGRPGRVIGKSNTLTSGALEKLPLLTPSRYDRVRYPDALDPVTALPAGEVTIKGALVTAVQRADASSAPTSTLHLVALKDGVAGDQRWAVTMPGDVRPVQRRGDVLRPVVYGGLARGAIVDVWMDGASRVRAVVLDRDDRPDAGADALATGWL